MIPANIQPRRHVAHAALRNRVPIDAPFLQVLARAQVIAVLGVRQVTGGQYDARPNHVHRFGGKLTELLNACVIGKDADVDIRYLNNIKQRIRIILSNIDICARLIVCERTCMNHIKWFLLVPMRIPSRPCRPSPPLRPLSAAAGAFTLRSMLIKFATFATNIEKITMDTSSVSVAHENRMIAHSPRSDDGHI